MLQIIQYSLSLIALSIASYTDIRWKEVPDWLSYAAIFAGLGINTIASLIFLDYRIITASLLGFAVCFALALIMYYSGQWGGGDSKILMGLGSLLGLTFAKGSFLLNLIIYIFIFGSVYGLFWSIILMIKNWKPFKKEFLLLSKASKKYQFAAFVFALVIAISGFFLGDASLSIISLAFALFIIIFFYAMISLKAVEKACMLKYINPEQLAEGDWVAEDIKIGNKLVYSKKELGISRQKIDLLVRLKKRHKINKVLVKYGIPFVPAFLIAFLLELVIGPFLGFVL